MPKHPSPATTMLQLNSYKYKQRPMTTEIEGRKTKSPDPPLKPAKNTKIAVKPDVVAKKRVWTMTDKLTLLSVATKRGASIKIFEGAIEGRSGLACYIQWRHVILPGLRMSIRGDVRGEPKEMPKEGPTPVRVKKEA